MLMCLTLRYQKCILPLLPQHHLDLRPLLDQHYIIRICVCTISPLSPPNSVFSLAQVHHL